jgi:hypothetical protein
MVKRIPSWWIQVNLFYIMASVNKKNKAKNSYLAKANKTTDKLKRINFYNKVNRSQNKCKVKDC